MDFRKIGYEATKWILLVGRKFNGRFLWDGWWIFRFHNNKKSVEELSNYLLFQEDTELVLKCWQLFLFAGWCSCKSHSMQQTSDDSWTSSFPATTSPQSSTGSQGKLGTSSRSLQLPQATWPHLLPVQETFWTALLLHALSRGEPAVSSHVNWDIFYTFCTSENRLPFICADGNSSISSSLEQFIVAVLLNKSPGGTESECSLLYSWD